MARAVFSRLLYPANQRSGGVALGVDGEIVALSSGMAVTIDLKTEDRRAIDYFASPLIELVITAGHEQ